MVRYLDISWKLSLHVNVFSVIGSYLKGSDFEEIIFQAKLYTSGCIKGIMNGKHYNRCWLIHEAFAQAVEKLFADEYLETLSPEKINVRICDILQCLNDKEVKEYISSTQSSYKKSQQGEFGYTGQYWMTSVGLVDLCTSSIMRMFVMISIFDSQFGRKCYHFALFSIMFVMHVMGPIM